jgi:hypothetical protein
MLYVVFTTILLIGALGLVAQLMLGGHFAHHGSHGHSASHAHGHHQAQHQNGSKHEGGRSSLRRADLLFSLLSPINIFSTCLGAGAAGLLCKHFHPEVVVAILIAAIGGVGFNILITKPLMSLLLNFASTPSKALDGSLAEPAEVISRFDSSGKGLVNLIVDGQVIRVLAVLEEKDRDKAPEIMPGDKVLVTYVDTHTNACRVSPI